VPVHRIAIAHLGGFEMSQHAGLVVWVLPKLRWGRIGLSTCIGTKNMRINVGFSIACVGVTEGVCGVAPKKLIA